VPRVIPAVALATSGALAGVACGPTAPAESKGGTEAWSPLAELSAAAAESTWTGTVTVSDSAAGTSSTDDGYGAGSETATKLNSNVVLNATHNGVVANVTYKSETRVNHVARYQYHTVTGSKTEETTASGISRASSVSIDMRDEGNYQINFSGGGVAGKYRMVDEARTVCTDLNADPTCRPGSAATEDSGAVPSQGGIAGSVDGKIDPTKPNVLAGTTTQRHQLNDGSTATRTISWNLSR